MNRHSMRGLGTIGLIVFGCVMVCSCRIVSLGGRALSRREDVPVSVAQARVKVAYNLGRGTFRLTRVKNPIRIQDVATVVRIGDRAYSSADRACRNRVVKRGTLELVIESAFENGPAWRTRFEIRAHPDEGNPVLDRLLSEAYGVVVKCEPVGESAGGAKPRFALVGEAEADKTAFACRLTSLIPKPPIPSLDAMPEPESDNALYDPACGCAVHLGAENMAIGPAQVKTLNKAFPVRLEFASWASIDFVENLNVPIGFQKSS